MVQYVSQLWYSGTAIVGVVYDTYLMAMPVEKLSKEEFWQLLRYLNINQSGRILLYDIVIRYTDQQFVVRVIFDKN